MADPSDDADAVAALVELLSSVGPESTHALEAALQAAQAGTEGRLYIYIPEDPAETLDAVWAPG